MRIRHLVAVLLILGLGAVGAMATDYTVFPTAETNTTGYTDYDKKYNGEALVYGGASSGSVRMDTGFFKFDVTSIPDAFAVSAVEFNFYVNDTEWPWFSITPVSQDPVPIFTTPELLWDDAQAEKLSGYYNQQNEGETYAAGWKTVVLAGTAPADMGAALSQDWFALGVASRDTSATYYLEIDGHNGANVPYLVVSDTPPPANDTCAGAIVIPGTPGTTSYSGDTSFANDDYNCNASCVGGLPHNERDVAYTVTLPAGCTICVTLYQSLMDWNGGVYMVEDCADVNGTCVAGASGWAVGGGIDEQFCYTDTTTETFYIIVDGRNTGGAGTFTMDVNISCIAAPYDVTCSGTGDTASLAWTNGDTYDSIEVYQDGNLVATLAGTATSIEVTGVAKGYHCYYVCGYVGSDFNCSDDCCLIQGYDNVEVLWDFEADDGGFTVDGTGLWQWGAPTWGPCAGTADGNVWATDLANDYPINACWLLDSAPIYIEPDKGGYVCFDHCYDTEFGFDGGVVWFTTDDFWYYSFAPEGGGVAPLTVNQPCPWTAGFNGFTGNSDGWVTDCWDFTDPMWYDEMVKIRFAFGSDSLITGSGWMVDNITVYNNAGPEGFSCDYTVTPLVGTVPFSTFHQVTFTNNYTTPTWTRRIAGYISVSLANGNFISPWKAGFTNVTIGNFYTIGFPVAIPAIGTVIGNNTFQLVSEDVTPPPFNTPPKPPAGETCTVTNVVVANAP